MSRTPVPGVAWRPSKSATLTSVARRVGYSTPYAFSSAFKRLHRVSPQQFRRQSGAPATVTEPRSRD